MLSSWAILAVTHHYIVRLAAENCGLKNFVAYLVLGDDIVIANKEVADEYKSLIERMGLEISDVKSVVPTEFGRSMEFASKLISVTTLADGSEVVIDYSPLPTGHIKEQSVDRLIAL